LRFGETVAVIGIGPVGLMAVAGSNMRGAGRIFAVGSRPICVDAAKAYGATDIVNYRDGDIVKQIMEATKGVGVDKVIIAGGDVDTFAQAITIVKPGGIVSNVNYLGEGDTVAIPRVEWGVGMGHKRIVGGLTPGGRYVMQNLINLLKYNKLDTSRLLTHRFKGFENIEQGLMLMRDKPRDLIKPVVTM
jgi:threonine dehydrogenase-like Zn-dependent dehydrogenase